MAEKSKEQLEKEAEKKRIKEEKKKLIAEQKNQRKEAKKKAGLRALDQKYGIDFTGHEAQLYTMDVLHRTIEYMRKHRP